MNYIMIGYWIMTGQELISFQLKEQKGKHITGVSPKNLTDYFCLEDFILAYKSSILIPDPMSSVAKRMRNNDMNPHPE